MIKKILKETKEHGYLLFSLLLVLMFFHSIIFQNKTFFLRDIHRWFYPMKFFLAKTLRAGEIPFWCSNYFCGSPFMSDIQSGVFYPLSIFYVLFPFPFSFNIFIAFHFFLAFCFFYLFILSLGLSKKTALLTSISYCYGGYIFATINTLNNLSTGIWLPAILWSFNRARKSGNNSNYALTILFLCTAILGGEPQLFILSAGVLFLYAVVPQKKDSEGISESFRSALTVVLLGICAVLITMVQLGPTYMDYHNSARMGGLSYGEASRCSLSFATLKHLLIPLHFGENFSSAADTLQNFFPNENTVPWLLTVYPGVIILPAALLGTIFSFPKKNFVWFSIFVISLILALGANTPAHFLFYKIFPFFRYPEKFMFTAGFSLLVLSAYGFEKIFQIVQRYGIKPNLIFCFLIIALTVDLYSNHRNLNPTCDSEFYHYHHPALDPILNDRGLFRVFADNMPTPPMIKNSIINHHIKWQMMLLPNLGTINNLYQVGGVPALELRYQHQIIEILSKPWKEKIRFLKLANVKYIISQEPLDKEPSLRGQVEKMNALVYRVRNFLPRAWVVSGSKKITQGTVNELTDGSFDPSRFALGNIKFEEQPSHNISFPGKEIDQIVYKNTGEIHIKTRVEKPGILVISESSYPGWKVYVDGRERECLWLDLLFQGTVLEPGNHIIEFRFGPKGFSVFCYVSLFSISLLILAYLWVTFKSQSKPLSFLRSRSQKKQPKECPT